MSATIARLDQRILAITNRLNDNLRESFDRSIAQERQAQAGRHNAQVQHYNRPNVVENDGHLFVDTGNESDHVKIEQYGTGDVTVTVNGEKTKHSDITSVFVETNGGDDVIETPGARWFSQLVPLPWSNQAPVEAYVHVDAGDGNDMVDLSAATGDTHILGGGGEDFLAGGAGSTCDGDFRTDTIFGDYNTDDPRSPDTVITQADSSNHLTVTDATWDPLDELVEMPAKNANCAPAGPENDPEILAASMGDKNW